MDNKKPEDMTIMELIENIKRCSVEIQNASGSLGLDILKDALRPLKEIGRLSTTNTTFGDKDDLA